RGERAGHEPLARERSDHVDVAPDRRAVDAGRHGRHGYLPPSSSVRILSGSLSSEPRVVRAASTAAANLPGPPKRASVSGGMNLNRMSAPPGGMPTKCTVSMLWS